ncbi:MAG: hypothetical protein OXC27_00850 [Caldilineaceae bacterium]|nr:hypothetical protein [Caldilineaceae bacterium]
MEQPRRTPAQPIAAALQATAANVFFKKLGHRPNHSHAACEGQIPGVARRRKLWSGHEAGIWHPMQKSLTQPVRGLKNAHSAIF